MTKGDGFYSKNIFWLIFFSKDEKRKEWGKEKELCGDSVCGVYFKLQQV